MIGFSTLNMSLADQEHFGVVIVIAIVLGIYIDISLSISTNIYLHHNINLMVALNKSISTNENIETQLKELKNELLDYKILLQKYQEISKSLINMNSEVKDGDYSNIPSIIILSNNDHKIEQYSGFLTITILIILLIFQIYFGKHAI